jgi:hypothetical protein
MRNLDTYRPYSASSHRPIGVASRGVETNVDPIGNPCLPTVVLFPAPESSSDRPNSAAGSAAFERLSSSTWTPSVVTGPARSREDCMDDSGREEGVVYPEGGGGMSVFSTLVAFLLGFGATTRLSHVACMKRCQRTVLVLGHVESTEKHDGFFSVVSPFRNEWRVGVKLITAADFSGMIRAHRESTDEEFTSITLPHPPNRSLPQP